MNRKLVTGSPLTHCSRQRFTWCLHHIHGLESHRTCRVLRIKQYTCFHKCRHTPTSSRLVPGAKVDSEATTESNSLSSNLQLNEKEADKGPELFSSDDEAHPQQVPHESEEDGLDLLIDDEAAVPLPLGHREQEPDGLRLYSDDEEVGTSFQSSALDPSKASLVDETNLSEIIADLQSKSPQDGGISLQSQLLTKLLADKTDLVSLAYAVLTGVVVATSVFVFDVSIQYIHDIPDILSREYHLGGGRATGLTFGGLAVPFRCVMPIGAGFLVTALQRWGFSPSLKFLTRAIEGVVDDKKNATLPKSYGQVFRKAAASAITLGSGASLGPEAPSVELGANTAAVLAPKFLSRRRQRMLVAAGSAAGLSAAFDAPVTGALFAVEFVLKSSRLGLDRLSTSTVFVSTSVAAGFVGYLRAQGRALGITGAATHLVGRIPYFSVQTNLLVDVCQFSVLGLGAAAAAVALYEGVRATEILFRPLPRWVSAPLAGAFCGIIAFRYPQVQYGYINLEEIFKDSSHLSPVDLTGLLAAKIAATAICVGGGLVGGLFAPSLFLGALVGDIMGHFLANTWGVVDPTTLTVVGAAAVLGASCRAPLTAITLMVEITRDTGLLVPLLAAIGVSSLISEYLEGLFTKPLENVLTKLRIPGIGSQGKLEETSGTEKSSKATVESVIAIPASLYVRHTLPLEQAHVALRNRRSQAAVVVDDTFTPMGLLFLSDIEAELIKQKLLMEKDNNFSRNT